MTDLALPGNARGRASRARLLDAARECFGRRGYGATRIADITDEAGMSQAGFYRHFADKEAILLEALREPLDALLAATGPLTEGSGADHETIVARNTEFFRVYAEHRQVLRVLRELAAVHEPGLDAVWLDVRRSYVARIERWLRRLQKSQGLQTSDVRLLADALGGVLDQLAYTRLALAPRTPTSREVAALGRVSGEIWSRTLGVAEAGVTPGRA
ncbi:MAG: TetR family transcriptional regulator [Solirubrobacterales bacterium]|nr:TetR family transcriptional regulator [Solirubrobacterales bacterium]